MSTLRPYEEELSRTIDAFYAKAEARDFYNRLTLEDARKLHEMGISYLPVYEPVIKWEGSDGRA